MTLMELQQNEQCVMRVVEGALIDKSCIAGFPQKVLQIFAEDPNWNQLLEVTVPFSQIKEIQKAMIKHYEGPSPWYMDGWLASDKDTVICAFGTDDGEGGKIFVFRRDDKKTYQEITDYAVLKDIPKEQIDFL